MDYCDVFTLVLTAPIHFRGSTGEQVKECYISPNLMKKQTLKGNTFSACFHFCRHSSFKHQQRLLVLIYVVIDVPELVSYQTHILG